MIKPRQILLIEPGYKNKYPPIGLMKLATYHRRLGDSVTFFKGNVQDFIFDDILSNCIKKLYVVDKDTEWNNKKVEISKYIKTRQKNTLERNLIADSKNSSLIELWLKHYSQYYKKKEYAKNPKYDRIYVTTLFTFYWDITIKAIEDAKLLVKSVEELKIGGVLASLLPNEVEETTGIRPVTGLLDVAGILDDNDIIIDDLPLDYSILDEIDYEYPTGSAYFTFMTKGCTRTCSFCSVPKLEPTYKEKIPTIDKFVEIKKLYGEQRHLLLMDNNVLASPKFSEIIQEIKEMGFTKGAKYIEPNQLDIAIKNLKAGYNDRANVNRAYKLLRAFTHRIKGEVARDVIAILNKYDLLDRNMVTKKNLLCAHKELGEIYEKYRDKTAKQRYVDFNQGTDSRYVTEENMKMLSEIPIYPLRIAFDHISLKKIYINAVRLAARHGIDRLSNYLLFNFNDRPEDLFNRMKINIELSEELNIHIYSFPMKYIPLFGEEAKHRRFVGKHWNKKFIRAIQSISNATRGIVPAGRSFFERAYGKDAEEYLELLYMPEEYLIYRKLFDEELGYTKEWKYLFSNKHLTMREKERAKNIIEGGDFTQLETKTTNKKILRLLRHYTVTRENFNLVDLEYHETKSSYDDLIRNDRFVDLTLTYDYENTGTGLTSPI